MKCGVYLAVLTVILWAAPVGRAQDDEAYRLGVQDRVRIHVHEWPVLTGEFPVGANGALVLPMLGNIPAEGLLPSELAAEIGNRLQAKAELSAAPDTTVDIAQYRPFYILGGVERPGEYAYRPGMMIVNAVAIAGGIYRPVRTSDWGFERDAITGRGDLRLAAVKRDELSAKEFRLKAEAEGLEVFPEVPESLSRAAMRFVDEERLLFNARLQQYRKQYDALGETVTLIEGEIKSLEGQLEAAGKQRESIARELNDTRDLVARKLAPLPRILPIERTLAQIEREQKEIHTAIMRARQQINATKIQRDTLTEERRSTAVSELQVLKVEREELDERVETATRLIAGSGIASSTQHKVGEVDPTPSFVIVRRRGGAVSEFKAEETTALQPGDVVKVFRPQDVGNSDRSQAPGAVR